jgi:hypothetical protein
VPGTTTVTDWFALPPVPVHVSVYAAVLVILVSDCEPEVALVPLQPPDAVHEVALVVDQVSVLEPPELTVAGLAPMDTVGGGAVFTVTVTDWLALPPAPVHVSV